MYQKLNTPYIILFTEAENYGQTGNETTMEDEVNEQYSRDF